LRNVCWMYAGSEYILMTCMICVLQTTRRLRTGKVFPTWERMKVLRYIFLQMLLI
jgi:hypothetical protein